MALITDEVAKQLKEEFGKLVHPVRLAVFSQALADPESEQVKRLVPGFEVLGLATDDWREPELWLTLRRR